MGLTVRDLSAIPDDPTPHYTSTAPIADELTALLRTADATWARVDGTLIVHPKDAPPGHSGTGTIVVSPSTGLVGRATVTDTGAQCAVLLEPRAFVGTGVTLESDAVNGTFRVAELIHRGDTWGGEFQTTLTLVRAGG